MHWVWLAAAAAGCQGPQAPTETGDASPNTAAHTYAGLADPEEEVPALLSIDDYLKLWSDSSNIVLMDVRKPEDYVKGHLAAARQVWRSDIESNNYPYSGMALEASELEVLMREKGVMHNSHIVVYDGVGGCDAARLWWMLTSYGYHKVSMLDGGWKAWKHDSLPWEVVPPPLPQEGDFRFADAPRNDLSVDFTTLQQLMSDSDLVILDTRTLEEYDGSLVKQGASYGGHIPGSVHYDWGNAIDMQNDCRLKPEDELRAQLEAIGATPEYHIVAYCHSGVRAAHTAYVLKELLGYPRVSNYDGSWIEWSYRTAEHPSEISTSNTVH